MSEVTEQSNELRAGKVLITLPEIENFFSNVKKSETCWNWTGYTDLNGYARLTIRHNPILGHVLSYVLHNGPIPASLHVCHSCDNPKCVNPEHLWLGTHQDNMDDRNKKGRCGKSGRRGEQINFAKVSESDVKEIRECVARGAKQVDMVKRFGIKPSAISSIINKRTWKHI